MNKNSRLVYSTEHGRVKGQKSTPAGATDGVNRGDGIVRIRRETSGRKGKAVTTITGLNLAEAELKQLAGELKRLCGVGGSAKNGVIEIQGDKRDTIRPFLAARGYTVKLAGG